jgi:hypothetical protein
MTRQSDDPMKVAVLRSIATKDLAAGQTAPVLALLRIYG